MASGGLVYDWTPANGHILWSGDAKPFFGAHGAAPDQARFYHARLRQGGVEARTALIAQPDPAGAPFQFEYALERPGQALLWVEDRGCCFFDENGAVERVIGFLVDITQRKAREASLLQAAHFDEMTGHLTRNRLRQRMEECLQEAQAQAHGCAYFVVAIDELAVLNEVYGIDAADEVIVTVGQRLADEAGPGAQIGRTAGNKFGVIVTAASCGDAQAKAASLAQAVQASIVPTCNGGVCASVSIGGIMIPADADTASLAMARAEEALDRAKAQGRGGFSLYEPSQQRESHRRRAVSIGDQILSALDQGRVRVAFQPIVDAKTGVHSAQECLARLEREDGSLMAAGEFIEIAEQLGLVRLIDRRMLELSLDELTRYPDLHLALNVSGMTASDRQALDQFASTLEARSHVAPRLIVELTETAALLDIEESLRFTARLHDIGARVAIDDFGAGYTSFRNLQALRVDMVKIDGSFVRGLAQSRDNQVFVRTLVDLARNFRLETVAEWVTSAHEADILTAVGVDYLQGFHFGKPEVNPPWRQ